MNQTIKESINLLRLRLMKNGKNCHKRNEINMKLAYESKEGYYLDNNQFSKCHLSCNSCTGPLISECISCSTNENFILVDRNCIKPINCIKNCLKCDDENSCYKCSIGFRYNNITNSCEKLETSNCLKFDNINKNICVIRIDVGVYVDVDI